MSEFSPPSGNRKALVFAQAMHRISPVNTLHVYADGIVLFLEATPDRHSAVRDVLKPNYPDFASARAKGNSVFVVPMHVGPDTPVSALPPLLIAVALSGSIDHRHEVACSLDAAVNQFWAYNRIRRHGLERSHYVSPLPPGRAVS